MRLLLVLLACVAAANAWSYSYQYYCSHQFHVYPVSSCYHYSVYFPSTWCSTSYYTSILKVYPSSACGTSGFKEQTPEEVVAEMKNLLNAALSKMTSSMYSKRNAWLSHLDSVLSQYKYYYKKYLYQFYAYRYQCGIYTGVSYISERDAKIRAYNAQLDKLRNEALANYNAAIAQKIAALKKYHADILEQGHNCLTTRVNKIAEFRSSIITKVRDGIAKFTKLHLSMVAKNKANYYNSLWTTFAKCSDFWTVIKGAISVQFYEAQERRKVENLVRIYALKLSTHYRTLLKYYTCAYKCYMSNGCIQFQKNIYYNQCKQIGTFTTCRSSYGVTKYCVSPFSYTWRNCVYSNLKTCDVNEDSRNADKVIADLKSKRDQMLKDNDSKFYSWKSQWVGYHLKYKAAFEKIVRDRHNWYCQFRYQRYISLCGYITVVQTAELAKLKSDLKQQAEKVCRDYYAKLLANIVSACSQHRASQAEFKKKFDELISKLQAKYNECASKKATAIVDYEKKIKAQRDAQRAKLVTSIHQVRDAHLAAFEKMIAHYHGSNYKSITIVNWMLSCYCSHIYKKVNSVIAQFDAYWRSMLPKLVHHFTCSYRCTISACVAPRYYCGAYYSWTYKLPTIYSYSYQLQCYRMYYR